MGSDTAPQKKKTVVIAIADGRWGGAQRHVLDLSIGIAPSFDVVLVCPEGTLAEKAKENGLAVITCDVSLFGMRKLGKILDGIAPCVINTHLLGTTFTVALSGLLRGKKYRIAATLHNPIIYEGIALRKRLLYPAVMRCLASRVACFAGVSRQICRSVAMMAPKCRAEYIPNAVAISPRDRDPAGYFPSGTMRIAVIGKVTRAKGHAYLIEAVRSLSGPVPLHVAVAGDGDALEDIKKMIHAKGLNGRFTVMGYCADIAALLKETDVAVIPSVFEGIPYAMLEAMAANVPVIASAVGGIPDVIAHEKDGLLVPAADPGAIASALQRLYNDRALHRSIAVNAKKKVAEWYGIEKMIGAYKEILAYHG